MGLQENKPGYHNMLLLCGWLFADMMLGLMVIFLVATPVYPSVEGTPTPTPSPLPPTATIMPPPTVTPRPTSPITSTTGITVVRVPPTPTPVIALAQEAVTITLTNAADLLKTGAPRELALQELRGKVGAILGRQNDPPRAGLVETFGIASLDSPGAGNEIARAINIVLRAEYPDVFGKAIFKDYHDIGAPVGSAVVEMYLLVRR